ncbi:hypothetical protein KKE14_02135, partial [Patescibacteria group bacterium]|nr:hypothetical protein [Patescibacteria group bacterium]
TPSSLTRLSICSFISLLITDLDILASFLLTHHTVRTNCLNFGVPASTCSHRNRPHKDSKEGVLQVLRGEFDTCRHCGTRFARISLPRRPLVMKCVHSMAKVANNIHLFDYSGRIPPARGE